MSSTSHWFSQILISPTQLSPSASNRCSAAAISSSKPGYMSVGGKELSGCSEHRPQRTPLSHWTYPLTMQTTQFIPCKTHLLLEREVFPYLQYSCWEPIRSQLPQAFKSYWAEGAEALHPIFSIVCAYVLVKLNEWMLKSDKTNSSVTLQDLM